VKASWTGVRFSPDPPKGDLMPVQAYYYSEDEWDRLGCGPLPPERNKELVNESASDGSDRFRHGEIAKEATRELTDVISKNK